MAVQNIFEELKAILDDFDNFLNDSTVEQVTGAIAAIAAVIPRVRELIGKPIDILISLRAEIEKLNFSGIPNADTVVGFADRIAAFLEASKALLPQQAGTIDDVLDVADVVSGLPNLTAQLKTELLASIDSIIGKFRAMRGDA